MSTQKGLDILVSIDSGTAPAEDWDVLGGQRNATLNRSAESIEVTDKTSANQWKEHLVSYKEWSIDCDGFYIVDDAAYTALESAFNAGTAVHLEIADVGGIGYEGSAIITDFPIEAPYDDAATYSLSFMGDGELGIYVDQPVITTASIAAGSSKTFAGTCGVGCTIDIFKNGADVGNGTVTDDDWTFNIATAVQGEVYTVRANKATFSSRFAANSLTVTA